MMFSNPTVAAFHVAVNVKILSLWVIAYHMYMPTYLHAANWNGKFNPECGAKWGSCCKYKDLDKL